MFGTFWKDRRIFILHHALAWCRDYAHEISALAINA